MMVVLKKTSLMLLLLMLSNLGLRAQASAHSSEYLSAVIDSLLTDSSAVIPPPIEGLAIGIPEPEFGIKETHTMYTEQFYSAGGFNYRDAGNGPYTHYVDNTAPNCNDNNAGGYGTSAEPLCSITR